MNQSSESEVAACKAIAFYLPQFYPFEENNAWWGKGFTEWTNVTKARPLFQGHYQPRLPMDLGFYDLRVPETRYEQIEMAKAYGIDAFCYHYYWFSGKRLLDLPVDAMLADSKSDMPFMLCWANENWTRRWDASEQTILIAQKYKKNDDIDFIKSVIPFFEDDRYLRVDGAPAFIVYRPQHLPNPAKTLQLWRDYCESVGILKLHLICAMVHGNENYEKYGFDAGVQFPPHSPNCSNLTPQIDFYNDHTGVAFDYADLAESYMDRSYNGQKVYRTVVPSWDNTARVQERALFLLNATPQNYEYWLKLVKEYTQEHFTNDKLLFINAWNEWAEGCHLEPERIYGHQYLEATKRVMNGTSKVSGFHVRGIPREAQLKSKNIVSRIVWARDGKRRTLRNLLHMMLRRVINPVLIRYPIFGATKRKIISLFTDSRP